MSVTETARRVVRSTLSLAPLDLVAVLVFVGLATIAVGSDPEPSVVQFLLGVGLVLFVPGYAVVAALFPGHPRMREDRSPTSMLALSRPHDGVLVRERLALSFGVSVLLIPLAAVALGALGVPLTTASTLAVVWAVVVAGSLVAAVRRFGLAEHERFDAVGVLQRVGADRSLSDDSTTAMLTVGLCLAVVLALGAFTVAIAGPTQTMSYTSASVLTTNASGEPVASGYPVNATRGEAVPLVVRVSNHYERPGNYTVVARLQRVDGQRVLASDRVWRGQRRVGGNETWTAPHTVRPTLTGQDLRLTYFVYRGPVPAAVNASTADKVLYLRFDVLPAGTRTAGAAGGGPGAATGSGSGRPAAGTVRAGG